jgi:hypothetical protein
MKLRYLLGATWLLLWAHPAFSQGCAMCYSSAAGLSHDGQHAINRAVLVLLLPPGTFMTLGLALAYRYSKKRDREELRVIPHRTTRLRRPLEGSALAQMAFLVDSPGVPFDLHL